jgi:hypothetical protein
MRGHEETREDAFRSHLVPTQPPGRCEFELVGNPFIKAPGSDETHRHPWDPGTPRTYPLALPAPRSLAAGKQEAGSTLVR